MKSLSGTTGGLGTNYLSEEGKVSASFTLTGSVQDAKAGYHTGQTGMGIVTVTVGGGTQTSLSMTITITRANGTPTTTNLNGWTQSVAWTSTGVDGFGFFATFTLASAAAGSVTCPVYTWLAPSPGTNNSSMTLSSTQVASGTTTGDSTPIIDAPLLQAAGTLVTATTGTKTVAWPTHVAGDVALLVSIGSDVSTITTPTLSTPAGFTQILSVEGNHSGVFSRLTVWWCYATSGAMASPVIAAGGGTRSAAQIYTFRNCNSAQPGASASTGVAAYSGLSVSVSGVTVTNTPSLVATLLGAFRSGGSTDCASWANASLVGFGESVDNHVTINGEIHHLGLAYGMKQTAGATVNTTATYDGTYAVWAGANVALDPLYY